MSGNADEYPLLQYLIKRRDVLIAELRHIDGLLDTYDAPYVAVAYERQVVDRARPHASKRIVVPASREI